MIHRPYTLYVIMCKVLFYRFAHRPYTEYLVNNNIQYMFFNDSCFELLIFPVAK